MAGARPAAPPEAFDVAAAVEAALRHQALRHPRRQAELKRLIRKGEAVLRAIEQKEGGR